MFSGVMGRVRRKASGRPDEDKRLQPIELLCHFLTWTAPSSWSLDAQFRRGLVQAVRERTSFQERDGCELVAEMACSKLPHVFLSEVLIPVPGDTATCWEGMQAAPGPQAVAEAIAAELGACEVVPAIQRVDDLDADFETGSPSVEEHIRSLAASAKGLPQSVVLIGDVVSRGSTLVACAHVLREAGYEGRVQAFACAYTRSEKAPARDYTRRLYQWDGRTDFPAYKTL